jgi:hypothetical protein
MDWCYKQGNCKHVEQSVCLSVSLWAVNMTFCGKNPHASHSSHCVATANIGLRDRLAEFGLLDRLAEFGLLDRLAEFGLLDRLAEFGLLDRLAEFGLLDRLAEFGLRDRLAEFGLPALMRKTLQGKGWNGARTGIQQKELEHSSNS